MRTQSYPSDVTDPQWALIEPHIPAYPGGRPRKTNLRDVVDAILYVLRTGCQWRYLPKDFPPKSTVWRYFDQWRHNGTLDTIHDALRRKVRTQEKPYAPRTTASVDSQSVDTTSGGEQRGRDNAKNVDGRKRPIVVARMGLLLAVLVTAAHIDDAKAATELFGRLDGQPMGKVGRMFADSKYHNFALYEWVEDNASWELVIVRRPDGKKGWVKLPLRWTVERTFAWRGKCRRLSKDREKSVLSAEAFVKLAMIPLMLIADKNRRSFAAMVACLDDQVGKIVAALDRRKMTANTLIVFCSDNGGPVPQGATNGPLRASKGTLYEGGVRVPACAAWPGHIRAGGMVNEPLHMVDRYPTLVKLAGGKLEQKLPLDGLDAWATVAEGKPSPQDAILLNAAPTGGAIRVGDWKLLINGQNSALAGEDGSAPKAAAPTVELFNLAKDPSEKTNLAAAQPDRVKELRARYDALAKQAVPPRSHGRPKDFLVPKVWGKNE